MKKLVLSILFLGFNTAIFAQNEKYVSTMTDLVTNIQSNYEGTYIPLSNKMERIAAAENKEWLPNYWVAFCLINETFRMKEAGEKDLLLDKAADFIKKAEAISPSNDEIEVLKAQYSMAKVSIDPMSRWQKYGADFQTSLKIAEELNPGNPRTSYVMAVNIFYTPEGFGGGKDKAKPLFEKTLSKAETFKSETSYSPNWGKTEASYFLSQY